MSQGPIVSTGVVYNEWSNQRFAKAPVKSLIWIVMLKDMQRLSTAIMQRIASINSIELKAETMRKGSTKGILRNILS